MGTPVSWGALQDWTQKSLNNWVKSGAGRMRACAGLSAVMDCQYTDVSSWIDFRNWAGRAGSIPDNSNI